MKKILILIIVFITFLIFGYFIYQLKNNFSCVDCNEFESRLLTTNYNDQNNIIIENLDTNLSKDELDSEIENNRQKEIFEPGEYTKIDGCKLISGDKDSPLKVLFVNIGNAYQFEEISSDIINNQLKVISPFKENFNNIVFYSVDIDQSAELDCSNYDIGLNGGFVCDNLKIYEKISKQCTIDDVRGIITIGIANSNRGGSGGEIIYVGSDPEKDYVDESRDISINLMLKKNIGIHEIAHNFGLADLYFGVLYFDGSPSQFWDTNFSRSFLNVDGPGCLKWCNSYKPVSEYTESTNAICLTFTEKEECVSHGRNSDRSCLYENSDTRCCVWSDDKFDYFNTNCVPAIGSEDIGVDCLGGSGCYFGAVYGNYAWRPVYSLGISESIMYGLDSNEFDSVSKRELNKIFDCCLSDKSSLEECVEFRKTYSDFLHNINFKKRIGSCGYKN